jgi:isopentenyl diphosphate isomerase/L-lactate dehydrogenase-like FMN-dependent dehydrogenase
MAQQQVETVGTVAASLRTKLVNLYDYEAAAERVLPLHLWDFIAGGSMDEITLRRNRAAFDALALRPHYLREHERPEIATTMLGSAVSMPVFISPAGGHSIAHPDAERATVRAAGGAGTLMCLSSPHGRINLDDVAAAASGPLWFQVYHHSREETGRLVHWAEEAGYRAIVVTCDVPVASFKERDKRHGFAAFAAGPPDPEILTFPVTPAEVEWLRSVTSLPIVLKGLNTGEDGRVAVECGVSGILVSTHGGRVFDTAPASIEALAEVVAAVGGRAEVYLDSGVRRGPDVVKALALGARAVGIGRPLFWGLAVEGETGVRAILEILRDELVFALSHCGQTSVQDIEPGILHVPAGWGTTS